jgi:Flp pilus assembly protein TadG
VRRGRDDGSISVEYAMFTPVLFLVLALIYAFARVTGAEGNLDTATRDAVRVASQAPDLETATSRAQAVLDGQFAGRSCHTDTGNPTMTLSGNFAPGGTLTLVTRCNSDLSDLVLPGVPGTVTSTARFSSMIDPNRTLG